MPEAELRSHLVVTLLAILELARLKVVRLLASDDEETLFITQVEGTDMADARRVEITSAGGEGGPDAAAAPAVTPATVDDHAPEAADLAGATAGSATPAEPEAKES